MREMPDVSAVISIFSNVARMKIIDELMDGRAHTVNELALAAKITPQTVTYHLGKMTILGWVELKKYGRFHYYSLIRSDIAALFENLSPHAPAKPIKSLRKTLRYQKMYYCRTCYDHVAGEIGVKITDSLIDNELITAATDTKSYEITSAGRTFLANVFDLAALAKKKRVFCKPCLDWSERRDHVAGAVGNGILEFLVKHDYLQRGEEQRLLNMTDNGAHFLKAQLGIEI